MTVPFYISYLAYNFKIPPLGSCLGDYLKLIISFLDRLLAFPSAVLIYYKCSYVH